MLEGFVQEGVPLTVFWIFVSIAILIQGVSKSGFAGGAGVLSVPLMVLVMPVDKVAATLLPILILCDINAISFYRRDKAWDKVMALYLPSLFGIAAGALVWWWVGTKGIKAYEPVLNRFVGVIAIVFAVYIFGKEAAMAWVERIKFGRKSAWAAGVSAGFCSTIIHAAGPIVGLYLFAQHMGRTLFIGSTAWTFALINITKLPVYFGVGLIERRVLLFDLLLVGLIPVGSYLGKWMSDRVSERTFNRVILVLTLVAGVQLVFGVKIVQIAYQALFHVH